MKVCAPKTPYGYSIFCDDIREEARGKVSFMGIYSGNMILYAAPPVSLPKLMVAVNYFERPGESDAPVEVRVYLPGDSADAPTVRVPLPVEELRASGVVPRDPDVDDPIIGCRFAI